MIVKLLTEHHLEFVRLKGGCTGSSESTLVKMSNCWKSHALAHISFTDQLSAAITNFTEEVTSFQNAVKHINTNE